MRSPAEQTVAFRTASTAMLLACAVALGYLESAVWPALPVPGVRLGVANVAVVAALALVGVRSAVIVSLGRVLLVGLAAGTLGAPGMLLALAGAVASLVVMVALRAAGPVFSVVGWSVGGAAAHVLGQVLVASVLVGSSAPLMLAPLMLGLSVPAGLATGLAVRLLLSRIPELSLSVAGR